jgi:hypothetical protein
VVTLFPFVADPDRHLILKPRIIKRVAARYGVDLHYQSRPNAVTYAGLLDLAQWLRERLAAGNRAT